MRSVDERAAAKGDHCEAGGRAASTFGEERADPVSCPPEVIRPRDAGDATPLAGEVVPRLGLAFDMAELLRCLGYPAGSAPASHVGRDIERLATEALPRLEPRGAYTLRAVTRRTARSLTLGETTVFGKVGEYLQPATRVAVLVVTVGDAISTLAARACRSGDVLAGWAFDAVGSWAAEAAADALTARLGRYLGPDEALTLRYSPGYCGMDLDQQPSVCRLARAEAVGVSLSPALLMQPTKSVSGLVGLGPKGAVRADLTPCDRCPQIGCHMRR